MKKYLKSGWMRVLSQMLCTISSLGLAVSILAIVIISSMGGSAQHIYRNIYEDIADGYALYAMEQVQVGEVAKLEEYFTERGIACSVTKQLVKINQEEVPESQSLEFTCGEIREDFLYQIKVIEGAYYQYNIDSLAAAFCGHNGYSHDGDTVSLEVEEIVFDKENGRFYYETASKYFVVENIAVYEAGAYTDYTFTKVDGVECYYNAYYHQKLDTMQYENWDSVRVEGERLGLSFEKGYPNAIYVTTSDEIQNKGIGKNAVYTSIHCVEYYPTDYVNTYVIQIDWHEDLVEEVSVFYEWSELCEDFVGFTKIVLPSIVINFILFIVSMALLIYSAINKKEDMGLLHKAPIVIYTGTICTIEYLLCALLVEGIPALMVNYGSGSMEMGIVLISMTAGVIIWLAIIWFQNIVTRLKCKSFWRTTEIYYGYKLIKDSWGYVSKACKWCWSIVMKPFKVLGKAFGKVLHGVGVNTPLFWGGLLIFGAISLVEFYAIIEIAWHGDWALFWVIKVVEVVALIIILYHMKELHEGGKRVASGDMSQPIDTERMYWKFKEHGENINKVSDGIALAVEERMKSERFKTELITNVSHDIKTPLTSIINYVDLMKKEEVQDEKLIEYMDVLDRQSARLKKLIEDLIEASKASTGNLAVNLEECDIEVLLTQVIGEFEERLEKNQLEVVVDKPDHPVKMMADGRHMWRVLDNLLNNACKYSLPGSRVYVTLKQDASEAVITFKNISKTALNIPSDELMERFVRGDSSRNTEGSGLGLSIAQSLTELMQGNMKLDIDGDLFKVILRFPIMRSK